MNVLKYPLDNHHQLHHRHYNNDGGEIHSAATLADEMISSDDAVVEEPEASASASSASKSPSVFHYKTRNPYVEERTICSKTKKAVVVRTVMAGVLPEDYEPSDIDVICGRGKSFHAHAGNRNFVKIIHKNAEHYHAAKNRFDKSNVVASVLATLLDEGVKFVKQNKTDKRYYQMSKDQAHEKCGHAIRDFIKNNPVFRSSSTTPTSSADVVPDMPDMTGSSSCNGTSSSRRGSTTSVNSMSTTSSVASNKSSSSSKKKRKSTKAKKEVLRLKASKATAKATANLKATNTPTTNTLMGMMEFHHSSTCAPSPSMPTQEQVRNSALRSTSSNGNWGGGGWGLVDLMNSNYNHAPTLTTCGYTSNNPMVVGRHRPMMATSMPSMAAMWTEPIHHVPVIFSSSSGTMMSRRHTHDGSTNAERNEIRPETHRSTGDLLSDVLKVQGAMAAVSETGSCCRDENHINDSSERSFHDDAATTTTTTSRPTTSSALNDIHNNEDEELEDDDGDYDDMFMPYPVASSDPEMFEHHVSELLSNGRNNSNGNDKNENETNDPNENSMTFENFLDSDVFSF